MKKIFILVLVLISILISCNPEIDKIDDGKSYVDIDCVIVNSTGVDTALYVMYCRLPGENNFYNNIILTNYLTNNQSISLKTNFIHNVNLDGDFSFVSINYYYFDLLQDLNLNGIFNLNIPVTN
jgi:hypothetical protein